VVTASKRRDDGTEDDPDDAEHGRGTVLGFVRKVNDHDADGVLAGDSASSSSSRSASRTAPRRLPETLPSS